MRASLLFRWGLALLLGPSLPAWASPPPAPATVYAAASLATAMEAVADRWAARGQPRPVLVLAASSTLARQIEAGAPADLFASADTAWMDYLAERGRVEAPSRVDLLANALVLVAPKGRGFPARMARDFDLPGAFRGRLCLAQPDLVPAGIYARQALEHFGWWPDLASRVAGADDVRAALAFVARGECAAGVVYATDARISDAVEVVARFPPDSHAPIVYPFALTPDAGPQARALLAALATDPELRTILRGHGFGAPAR